MAHRLSARIRLLLLLLAVAAPGSAAAQVAPIPVEIATLRLADVPITVEGIGTVQAANTVSIRAQVDGILQEVRFREGERVRPGDVLGQIDPRPYQAVLDQVLARKAQDEAQLQNAQLNLQRFATLARDDFASRQQLTNQQAMVAQLQAQVQGDEAAISQARVQLGFTTLTSPTDGITGIRQVSPGNLLRAAEATTLVVITQIQPIDVIFTLPAGNLTEIRQAMARGALEATVFERQGDRTLGEGTLLLVDNEIDPSTGQLRLKARLPNADGALWPGQFVTVRLLVRTDAGVPTIPSSAIQRGPDGYWVYVVGSEATVTPHPVRLRHLAGGIAALEDGLPVGTRVVSAGQYRLQPGSRILATNSAPAARPE
ncbi:efflux RND transporter periplasmic adaptor subunit [Neoroseomonas lacus]|uniref:Multidrug transporter n=1 Tax=Neoroseomonas lacus TaxID=287609 RepID=A0A917NIX4_9PROT|nr:efflux RND transporter periplasmic adaptor subunit [Neoroseomonas lacus]GGJ04704.1 multidrug transporter [Neoroseomonas lacus]